MPKEYTHWYVAELCRGRLPELPGIGYGSLADLLARYRDIYLIGAVAPDLLFYSKEADRFRPAADAAHGVNGEDTFLGLRRLLSGAIADSGGGPIPVLPGPILALACGIVAHIAADAAFHPLVYYFSGASIERHWVFETCMDRHVMQHSSLPEHLSVARLIHRIPSNRNSIVRALSRYFFDEAAVHEAMISRTLTRHARIQRLFGSAAAAAVLRAGSLCRPRLRPFLGLFYHPQRQRSIRRFDAPISFTHPVTGRKSETTFDRLATGAAESAESIICDFWAAPGGPSPESAFAPARARSLETGLPVSGECVGNTDRDTGRTIGPAMPFAHPELFEDFLPSHEVDEGSRVPD